jgi:hypothetical protein
MMVGVPPFYHLHSSFHSSFSPVLSYGCCSLFIRLRSWTRFQTPTPPH